MTNINEKFNACDLNDYITQIKGLPNTSGSPTETWIVEFKDDITYNDKPIKKAFLKIFMDTDNLKYKTEAKLALKYELNIYKNIINNIIKYKICPNFIKYLACGEKCSYDNLINILYLHLSGFTKEECVTKLNRNLYYIYTEKKDRPEIQDDKIVPILRPLDFPKLDIKYNIILMENIDESFTLYDWMKKYYKNVAYDLEFWNILFQISVSCYVMSLSKLVHNDLHSDNIFIRDLGSKELFVYNINDKQMIIKTQFQPLIYDFDRGYSEKMNDNPLLTSM